MGYTKGRTRKGGSQMPLIKFMTSPIGRAARILLGLVLIVLGLAVIGGQGGLILAIIGIVPIALGALDVCILAPAFGCPLRGAPR